MTVRTMVNPGSRLCAFVRWVEFASPLLLVLYFLTFSSEMKGQRRWWGCSSSLCRSSAFLSPQFFGSQSPLLSVSPVFLVSPALRGFFFCPVLGLLFPQFSPGFFSLSAWLFRVPGSGSPLPSVFPRFFQSLRMAFSCPQCFLFSLVRGSFLSLPPLCLLDFFRPFFFVVPLFYRVQSMVTDGMQRDDNIKMSITEVSG